MRRFKHILKFISIAHPSAFYAATNLQGSTVLETMLTALGALREMTQSRWRVPSIRRLGWSWLERPLRDWFAHWLPPRDQISEAQIASVRNSTTPAVVGHLLNTFITCIFIWHVNPGLEILAWGVTTTSIAVAILTRRLRHQHSGRSTSVARQVTRALKVATVLALPWGLLVWIYLGGQSHSLDLYLVSLAAGMAAAGAVLLGPIFPAAFAYVGIVLGLALIKCIYIGFVRPEFLMLAGLVASYGFVLFTSIAVVARLSISASNSLRSVTAASAMVHAAADRLARAADVGQRVKSNRSTEGEALDPQVGLSGAALASTAQSLDIVTHVLVSRGEELARSEARIAALVDSAMDAIVGIDSCGCISLFNRAAERLFRTSASTVIGLPATELLPERKKASYGRRLREYLRGSLDGRQISHQEAIIKRFDGVETLVEFSIAGASLDNKLVCSFILRDVSRRRQAERVNASLAAIVASSTNAIVSSNLEGTAETWNEGAEQLFGYSATEMVGRSLSILVPENLEFERVRVIAAARCGRSVRLDTLRRHSSGRLIDVTLSASPLRSNDGKIFGMSVIYADISSLKAAQSAISHSQERLQLALEASSLGSWDWNCATSARTWDRRAREIWGIDECVAVTSELIKSRIHPDDRGRFVDESRKALMPGGSERLRLECRLIGGVGRAERWVAVLGRAQFEAGKILRFTGTVRDISTRKAETEHLKIVMRELSHRAKNLLAVIGSIARNSAAATTSIEEFSTRFSDRLQCLARSHDLLVEQDWVGADLKTLVASQLSPFADSSGERLRMEGPDVLLKPTAAQMIGLALHELATNASKYGAYSNASGRIHVLWRSEVDDKGTQNVHLSWREMGGPPVQRPVSRGFGSTMTETMIEKILRSAACTKYSIEGVSWSATIPAIHIMEPEHS